MLTGGLRGGPGRLAGPAAGRAATMEDGGRAKAVAGETGGAGSGAASVALAQLHQRDWVEGGGCASQGRIQGGERKVERGRVKVHQDYPF